MCPIILFFVTFLWHVLILFIIVNDLLLQYYYYLYFSYSVVYFATIFY